MRWILDKIVLRRELGGVGRQDELDLQALQQAGHLFLGDPAGLHLGDGFLNQIVHRPGTFSQPLLPQGGDAVIVLGGIDQVEIEVEGAGNRPGC